MKDHEIVSDDRLIVWAAEFVGDPSWIEHFEARQDRNYRFQKLTRERNELRKKWGPPNGDDAA